MIQPFTINFDLVIHSSIKLVQIATKTKDAHVVKFLIYSIVVVDSCVL